MDIDSLFGFNVHLYNILLNPKIFVANIKYRKGRFLAKSNEELKHIRKTDTVYICGNGPSLKKVDFTDIKDDYIVVNDFYRFSKKDLEHPPTIYMIMDAAYIRDDFEERYHGVFNPGFNTTYVVSSEMMEKVNSDYPGLKKYYLCNWGRLFSAKQGCDFTKVHGRTWNIVSEAILLAIYMGYKEIRLLGCDYSVFASNAHFYDNIQAHPELRKMLFKYCFSTEVHYEIQKYASSVGVKIINDTKDSLLDAYEMNLDSQY